ncbi:MAG TPA: cupredoxin domain-containing protein [Acidimicrobiales bacterium]|jgi:plastocyanin|nr:cupredoxin domain-containing protein [Acidimicrobiales bacterium]
MLTPTSKVFLPVSGVALLFGAVYKILTGDVLGGTLFVMVAAVAFVLGVMLSTVRENEYAPAIPADAPPPGVRAVAVAPVPGGGGWSAVAAASIGLIVLGVIVHPIITAAGALVGLAAGVGWLARAASESTGRPISLMPVGMPVMGLVTIASVVFFMSRILLTVPKQASTVVALVVAVLILGTASLFALRPAISSRAIVAALAVGALVMVGGGVAAAAHGERKPEERVGGPAAVKEKAQNISFAVTELTLKADSDVSISFTNADNGIQHNIDIFSGDPTQSLFKGALVTGVSTMTYTFHAPAAGTYSFQCDVHPTMKGTVKVE